MTLPVRTIMCFIVVATCLFVISLNKPKDCEEDSDDDYDSDECCGLH